MKYTDISVKNNKKYKTVMCILAVIGVISGCGNTSQQTLAEIHSTESPQNVETLGQENLGDASAETEQESQNSVGTQASGQNVAGAQTSSQESQNTVNAQGNQDVEGTNAEVQSVEQERKEPVKVKGIYVSGPIAGNARMDELIELVDTTELNAMVIDIKNDDGRVTYKMDPDTLVSQIGASINYVSDMKELVQRCKEKNIYLIARVVAFKDPYLAQQRPELAVRKKNGDIFYDKSGLAWVNPYNREVWDYLVEIGTQAAEAGFDEVQFDYIRFSTDLKTDKMDFGPAAEEQSKTDVITEFTQYAYDKLSPEGVYVSADVYGTIIDSKIDQDIVGQNFVDMAFHLDYICPMVYPSHYANGVYGIPIPDAQPYDTVKAAMQAAAKQLEKIPEENRAAGRVWIQSFTASWVEGHISYGSKQIRDQIQGAHDAGFDEWILWNAAVKYKEDSLLTEDEARAQQEEWDSEMSEAIETAIETTQAVEEEAETGGTDGR
ncbi:MAG: putative glycoside hydrolase [Lachnospiraceae bacterium]